MGEQARTSAETLLRVVEEQTGFFVEQGIDAGEPIYGFIHRSFAEYLAGRHLFEQHAEGRIQLAEFAVDERWGDAVRLFFGHAGRASVELVSGLVAELLDLDAPYERHLHRGTQRAVEVLADHVRVRPAVASRVLKQAVDLYLSTPYNTLASELQPLIVRAIASMPETAVWAGVLPESTEAGAASMRLAHLLWGLSEPGDQETLQVLVSAARASPDRDAWRMFEEIAAALLGMGSSSPGAIASEAVSADHADTFVAGDGVGDEALNGRTSVTLLVHVGSGVAKGHSEASIYTSNFLSLTANAARHLESAGIPRCTIGDVASQRALPPATLEILLVDLADVMALDVGDFELLISNPLTQAVAFYASMYRELTDAELAEVPDMVSDSEDESASAQTIWAEILVGSMASDDGGPPEPPRWLLRLIDLPDDSILKMFVAALFVDYILQFPPTASWMPRIIEAFLLGEGGMVAVTTCWAIQAASTTLSDGDRLRVFNTLMDHGVGAALATLMADHPDVDVRAEARRAWVLATRPQGRLVDHFLEDGVSRGQSPYGSGAPAGFAGILTWLIDMSAVHRDPEDASAIAEQVGRLLAWPAKPSYPGGRSRREAPGHASRTR